MPLLDKPQIVGAGSAILWHDSPGGAVEMTTGGSTGDPLRFFIDRRRQAYDQAARMRSHRWFGVEVGAPELYLWGSPIELSRSTTEIAPVVEALNGLLERERRFTADAAHELRTPIAAIKIHAQNAARAASDAERNASLGRMLTAVERSARLAEQMLAYRRATTARAPAPMQRVSMRQILEDALEEASSLAGAGGALGERRALGDLDDTQGHEQAAMLHQCGPDAHEVGGRARVGQGQEDARRQSGPFAVAASASAGAITTTEIAHARGSPSGQPATSSGLSASYALAWRSTTASAPSSSSDQVSMTWLATRPK